MVEFLEAAGRAIKKKWCSYSKEDELQFALAGLIVGAPSSSGLTPAGGFVVAKTVEETLEELREASDPWCNRSIKSDSSNTWKLPPPRVPGGKCPVDYQYEFTWSETFLSPVSPPSYRVLTASVFYAAGTVPTGNYVTPVIIGAQEGRWIFTPPYIDLVGDTGFNPSYSTNRKIISFLPIYVRDAAGAFTRPVSTLTGDCKNEDSADGLSPLDDIEDLIDIEYEDDDGNLITEEDAKLTLYPPCMDADGAKIPFKLESELGDMCGKLDFGLGGGGINTSNIMAPGVVLRRCPENKARATRKDEPEAKNFFSVSSLIGGGNPSSDGEYSKFPEYDLEDDPILGVFFRALESDNPEGNKGSFLYGSESNSDAPTRVVPRVATVRFLLATQTSDEDSEVEWSQQIIINQLSGFVPCPWEFGAVAVEFDAETGWEMQYRLARRKSCCDSCMDAKPEDVENQLDRCA